MAHFAQLDKNNKVIRVIVVGNEFITNDTGIEIEQLGIDFCKHLTGNDTTWVQTSYNRNFRKNFAGPGHTYDPVLDAFIPEKMYESWVLNNCFINKIQFGDHGYEKEDLMNVTVGITYDWAELRDNKGAIPEFPK